MRLLESEGVDFGDERLKKRYERLLEAMVCHPDKGILAACRGGAEVQGAYRFFNNDKVTAEKILSSHYEKAVDRIRLEERVLLIQDTTTFMYMGRDDIDGMGMISSEAQQGSLCHPVLAVTPERVPLGLVDCYYWNRQVLEKRTVKDRASCSIEEKESYRWIKSLEVATNIQASCPGTSLILVGDRENDIYEFISNTHKVDWLIRAGQDRYVQGDMRLWERMATAPVIGKCTFTLPAKGGKKARFVEQEIRCMQVQIQNPRWRKTENSCPYVTAIYCQQKNNKAGEKPINWMLLTSLKPTSLAEYLEVIRYYGCRWEIEVFFKILKSGCNVEKLQFTSCDRLMPCIALYMVVAWQIHYCARIGRECPNISSEILFEPTEWKLAFAALYKTAPQATVPTLAECLLWIAQLGGYIPRKSAAPPGPTVMWRGFSALHHIVLGANLALLIA